MGSIETLSQPKAVAMVNEWFQLATADHFWMQWRHHLIILALKSAGGSLRCALEVSCGNGVARKMLEHDLDIAVDGCDLNLSALAMAKPGRGRLFIYDVLDQEPAMLGRYDAIFLLDVIEHIFDDKAFLVAASRHSRPGRVLVVNVPASMRLFSDYDRVQGHVRRYTPDSVSKLFDWC
jgi:2-polyprenyl-3-methyl-5-hydroxy-6-metoxy-1,4-benzoquinol methylase